MVGQQCPAYRIFMNKKEYDRQYSANYRKKHALEVKESQRLGHLANPSAKNKQARAWQN
jgi:hypothetical protein